MYEVFMRLCESKGVSPTSVLLSLGITKSTLSGWKEGKFFPNADKIRKISNYFGVPMEYLMTGVMPAVHFEDEETAAIAQAVLENKDLRGLFMAAKDAKPEDIQHVYETLLFLKSKENQ